MMSVCNIDAVDSRKSLCKLCNRPIITNYKYTMSDSILRSKIIFCFLLFFYRTDCLINKLI